MKATEPFLLFIGMASRKNRDSMVIATKYGSSNKLHDRKNYPCQSNWGGAGTKSMKKSLEESLEKLQTPYVDILFLHWWDYATTIPELMHSLNDLVVAGKVHYLGISDTPAWVVSKVSMIVRYSGESKLISNYRLINMHAIMAFVHLLFTRVCGTQQNVTLSARFFPSAVMRAWEFVHGAL
jgi:aryl-alcohol dehydrogenase-like predicted oxidoreductase